MSFQQKAERDRISAMLTLAKRHEALRLLTTRDANGYYAQQLINEFNLPDSRSIIIDSDAVLEYIKGLGITPDSVPAAPPPNAKPCDGCGGVGDAPEFLRWGLVARGLPVIISVDEQEKPVTLEWLTPEMILKEWFEPWSVDTSIRFKLVPPGTPGVHIRGRFGPIDGPGGTRGMAWLPDQSVELMESGGEWSGDFLIDSIDRWTSVDEVHETGEHEGGHCIGLPHTENPEDVMYPYSRGVRRVHSLNDKRAKTARYPMEFLQLAELLKQAQIA